MTIKTKAQMICILATVICLGVIYCMTKLFVVRNLLETEKGDAEADMLRAVKAFSYALKIRDNFTDDWAAWDDSYYFVQQGNEDYIVNNLMDATYKYQRINVMAYFDAENNCVYAKWFDLANEQAVDLPPEKGVDVLKKHLVFKNGEKMQGIIRMDSGPLLVVARSIVDSQRTQPSRGTLIVGRYLDGAELDVLAGLTNLKMGIRAVGAGDVEMPGIDVAGDGPPSAPVNTQINEQSITSGMVLKDLTGEAAYLLTVEKPRTYYQQGERMLQLYLMSLSFAAVLFGCLMFLLIDRHIVGRLLSLTKNICKIKSFKDIPPNFGVTGVDEISELAGKIKGILHELQLSHEKMSYISTHDTLTKAYNRTYFEQYMQEMSQKPHRKMGVFICDIDGLKLANDLAGHAYGDELLQHLAGSLRKACPDPALLFRMGGDEFLIIVEETEENTLHQIKQRIRRNVEEDGSRFRYIVPLSVSVGYAILDTAKSTLKEAIKTADNLMYREKLLHTQSRRSGLVQTLRSALEARDHITEGHARRLQALAVALARRVGVPEQRLPDLQLFAEFHDVGKIGISDAILFKQGPLTPDEWSEMQTHCEIGFRIAQSTTDLLPISLLILKHHEWWNGAGYPLGLAGEDIPIECRILAIVDAFDAMTNERPYRNALTAKHAIGELTSCAGRQFDPELVKVFVRMITGQESQDTVG